MKAKQHGFSKQGGLNSVIPNFKARLRSSGFICGGLFLFFLSSCSSEPKNLTRFEFDRTEMGVPFRIVLYSKEKNSAEVAANAAWARVEKLNSILSDYDPDSELSRLSQVSGSGKSVRVSDELWFVLSTAQKFSEQSRGAFDVTVGPVVNLWRYARRAKKFPDAERLARARATVGFEKIRLDSKTHSVELPVPNMRLDLGAIAKGYAVDQGLRILREHGITRAFVSGGGDMAIGDPPPGKAGWKIELASIDETQGSQAGNTPGEFVIIKNCGLATSGDLFQFVEIEGRRYSHIVDPRTGIGLIDHSLVTVIAQDGITADAFSTTVSVLGPDEGLKLIEATPGAAARILRRPNGQLATYESKRFNKFRNK